MLTQTNCPTCLWCGGTLISPRHVLSAGHCLPEMTYKKVYVGVHSISPIDGIPYEWCHISRHPDYNYPDNDFMIIHLKESVQLNHKVGIACLPSDDDGMDGDFFAEKNLVVSGWGNLEYEGHGPSKLHSVTVPGISKSECENKYCTKGDPCITDNMLCAGDVFNGGVDACQGDSGGNLI